MTYNILILFLLIFCFPIAGPVNSAYIAVLLALSKIVVYNKIDRLVNLFSCRYIKLLSIATIGITLLSGFWTFILGSNDYSLTAAFFSVLIGIICLVIVVSSLSFQTLTIDFVEKYVVNIFVLQSIISIVAFVSPVFREVVHHFQFENEADMAEESYSGIRGLSISGRLYFEFAASCGLATIVQFKRIIADNKRSICEYIKLFLIIICGFFSGRTSLIGIAFGFIYLCIIRISIRKKLSFIAKLAFMLCLCIFIIISVLPDSVLLFITDRLLPWVFDLFIKYHETGSTESSHSFNMLNEMYRYVHISSSEWIYGSGHFMAPNGIGYYKSVDGGYIRHLLYWGVIGSIINIAYGLLYFIAPYKNSLYNNKLYIILIMLYTFFIHYKGDLATTSRFFHVILIFILIPYTLNKYGTNRYCAPLGR